MISTDRRVLIAVMLTLLAPVNILLAHAVLLQAVPPVNGSISGPEVIFRLRFNSRIDGARSTLKLALPDGSVRSLTMGEQPTPDTLTAKSSDLKAGHYTLRWQVLAADGHITRGEIPFDVR